MLFWYLIILKIIFVGGLIFIMMLVMNRGDSFQDENKHR